MNAAESIRELTLPVVLISANGLICLALYNRLAAVTSRLRAFCRERFEMQVRLSESAGDPDASIQVLDQLRARLSVLELQRGLIFRRAVQLRNALVLLLSAVVGLLVTSLLLGLAERFSLDASIPLASFVFGTLAMIGGIVLAIGELMFALDPVQAEHEVIPSVADPEYAAD